jgi:enoyl-CoA hydratase/carnithine racemase
MAHLGNAGGGGGGGQAPVSCQVWGSVRLLRAGHDDCHPATAPGVALLVVAGGTNAPADLLLAVDAIAQDHSVRAVVLAGASAWGPDYPPGSKGGTGDGAGAEVASLDELDAIAYALTGQEAISAVAALPKPVLCAVDGECLGPGLELALAADIRVAARDASLGMPQVRSGLAPAWGGMQRLLRLVGPGHAKRLVLGGAPVGAVEAYRIGLVEALADGGGALLAALELAAEAAHGHAPALAVAKETIDAGADLKLEEGLRLDAAAFGRIARGRQPLP